MTQRASESLVAVLIRIGLLLALAVLLMAENAQAETAPPNPAVHPRPAVSAEAGCFTSPQRIDAAGAHSHRTA